MAKTQSHERNIDGLRAHVRRRAEATKMRVSDAIDRLVKEDKSVTFSTVATAAVVSRNYLYEHRDLADRIEAIRLLQGQERQQRSLIARQQHTRTDGSKDVLLAARERRIRELESDTRRLKEELKILHGKLYDKL